MVVTPLIFVIFPLVAVIVVPASSAPAFLSGDPLVILLGIPAIVPSVVAAYSVAGERGQGTLEPVLTTPIRRSELLLAKALAVLVPSLAVAYVVYAFFLTCTKLFAAPAVASAILQVPDILAQLLFSPLVAVWSIWIGIAVSTRSNDVRVAQQLGALASLPVILLVYLIPFGVIPTTPGVAFGFAAVLLVLDGLGWRIVSAAFDRERLVTGTKS
jgi:ABC-type Na+ efflux pump permease subunit